MSNNSSILRTSNTVVTAYGVYNQMVSSIESVYEVRRDSTINFKRNCFPSINPTRELKTRYFGVGINGFVNTDDANSSVPFIPDPLNLDLYEPIPFRCIPVAEDVAFAAEREAKGYRMRVKETINGQQYWCYYLKRIQFIETSPKFTLVDADDHEIPYTIDHAAHINPVPAMPTDTSIVNATTNRIVVSMTGIMQVTGAEVMEYINLKYGNPRKAKISEIGTYTGEEKLLTPEINGSDITYTEAVYTQLASHRCWLGVDLSDPTSEWTDHRSFENGTAIMV